MELTFDQQLQRIAVNIRGAYLDMACDLEFMLVDIACICLVKEKRERDNVRDVLLEGTYMAKKITVAERALEIYNCHYYKKYKAHFAKFRELTGWRNKFAHSRIKGDPTEQDLSFVIFEYIKDGKMIEKKENVKDLIDKLAGYASFIHSMTSEIVLIMYHERGLGL